jgi:hypothetical protein
MQKMIDRLTKEERIVLMELLVYLVKEAGNPRGVYQEVLSDYAELVGVNLSEIDGNLSLEELVPQFQSHISRFVVLQEVFRLAELDGIFTIGEQSIILDIASLMGFPMDFVRHVEQWVREGLEWTRKGEMLIDEAQRLTLRIPKQTT